MILHETTVIDRMFQVFGFFIYTYSILFIVISQGYHLVVARIMYFACCSPNLIAMICSSSSYIVGSLCFTFIIVIKYSLILALDSIPDVFYYYILLDNLLVAAFIFLAYLREQRKNKASKVIPKVLMAVNTKCDEICSICLESMELNIVKTICQHNFHDKCLLDWIKLNTNCPLCRNSLGG